MGYIKLIKRRKNSMNKQEINEFIGKMEEVGDVWTEEQVNDVYGDSRRMH